MSDPSPADPAAPLPAATPLPPAAIAAILAEATQDVLFVAADEQRAERIAAIVAGFAPETVVVHVPSSDALPGDDAPASPANTGRRVAALRRVRATLSARAGGDAPGTTAPPVLLVTTAEATATRLPPPAAFDAAPPHVAVGDPIDLAGLTATLTASGYTPDDRVDEPGEVALRGEVIDVFPADHAMPVRIEGAAGHVTAIRRYDAVTQRSTEELDRVELGRASEPEADAGVAILDHLPGAALALDHTVIERRARFLAIAGDRRRAMLVDAASWQQATAERPALPLDDEAPPPPRFVERRSPTRAFARFAGDTLATGRLVLAGSARDLRFLAPRLARAAKIEWQAIDRWTAAPDAETGSALLLETPIDRGFVRGTTHVVAAADLLGGRADDDAAQATSAPMFAEVGALALGDVVVHEDFGLGLVAGLEALADGGDALILTYAREARRLVPVAEADRVWRYGAEGDGVTLDALDGSSWQKRRGAIDAAVAESATALAALAAERDARTTDPVAPDPAAYERFAAGFAFTETADQARAIAAVRADLASGTPMDRLVVGDVGYGKTEVALRAAALAALAGRQVALAAPTTVLVRQHLDTFARRFEGTGIAVAGLSRLSSAAEKKAVKAGLADGSIGVVIGTGAVAGKGVVYRDLALVVIDEEQRFGTADKNRLHALGAGSGIPHVLTLSATPIPRTLQSALVGLQRISTIATPPARRQPIRTAVAPWDDATIRTALLREHGRGGQSFVVVPRIDDMAALADKLARLVPELSLVQAHGRMAAADIDAAMVAFANGEGDVLLATNIIEAGLDVPRANTMVVHRADCFGLSQLHQLRGRVGRGGRRGQVLLTTQGDAAIAPATLKRLRTLQAFDRLGAGFAIAARDLDLRGAGDLVGEEQAGHMKLIGIDLYQFLLTQALRQARGETVDGWTPELNVGLAGRLPEAWIPDIDLRLGLYGRLARLRDDAAIDGFAAELEDRFGPLPAETTVLLDIARTRILACRAGVAKIDAGPAAIALSPRHRGAPVPAGLTGKENRWLLAERIDAAEDRLARVQEVLEEIAEA